MPEYMGKLELTIIIVNWNTRDLLKNCLDSIFKNYKRCFFEVIVVDNNSGDESMEMVEKCFPEVRKLKNIKNLGFARANNQGIAMASGEYILILNPDIIVKSGTIESMLDFLKSKKDAAAVGAKLLNPDGSVQMEGFYRKFPSIGQVLLFETFLSKIFIHFDFLASRYLEDRNKDEEHEVEQIPGACLLIKRKVIDEIGLLDEDFFIWYEDVDWCFRMKKAGWKLYYIPQAEAIHLGGQSFLKMNTGDRIFMFYSSLMKFLKKHYTPQSLFFIRLIVTINFIMLNAVQVILYPLAVGRKQKWKDNISARIKWIRNEY